MRFAARVKWFSRAKGYGFVEVEDVNEDIFLHSRVIRRAILHSIVHMCAVNIQYVKVERGLHAVALKLPEGGDDA
jgi:cold shock protein